MRLLFLALLALPCFGAYSACVAFTPAGSQVSGGPHTDYTIKIHVTKSYLAGTGSGGLVTDANAYDVVPHSGSDCAVGNKLTAFKVISYNSSTGEIYMHVLRSSFGSSTVTYLGIGDATITTDQASGSPYDTATRAAWALDDNAASTTVLDRGANGYNGTHSANTSGKSTTGRLGRAIAYASGSSDYTVVTHNAGLDNVDTGWSACFWLKQSATTGVPISKWSAGTGVGFGVYSDGNWYVGDGVSWTSPTADRQSDGNWHYYCIAHDTNDFRSYRDGAVVGGPTSVSVHATTTTDLNFGRDGRGSGGGYISADIDEITIARSARGVDWFTTDYNMGTQSSFWSITNEPSASAAIAGSVIVIQ